MTTSSRLFPFGFQIPDKQLLFYPVLFLEGTLPVALTCSPNVPTVLNVHISTPHLYLKQKIECQHQTNIYIPNFFMYPGKNNQHIDFFLNFRSQCSVTKHIVPLIHLTNYTYEWYCLKTLEPRLLRV